MELSQNSFFARRLRPLAIALAVIATGGSSLAQGAAPGTSVTVSGTVRTASGRPVSSAEVSLTKAEPSSPALATTTAEGEFVVSAPGPGDYTLKVMKPGFRTLVIPLELTAGNQNRVSLKLEDWTSKDSRSQPELEFSDQPNFAVAGVTDATGVGGHGSTATLPTSESLARETVRLKSDEARPPVVEAGNSESELQAALERAPHSFSANHELGEFYLYSGKPRQAIPPLEAAYELDPRRYENAYELAMAYEQSGDFVRARKQLAELLAKDNRAAAHRLLGEVDEQSKEPLAAVKEYEQAVHLDPSEANYFAWGSELLLHRAIQPATTVFSQGVKAYPGSARMLAGLGAALYAGGSIEAATERLCQASDLAPGDEAPHLFLGKIEETLVQTIPCAEEKLGRFRENQPENPWANYYYALALSKRRERLDQPVLAEKIDRLLENAIAIDPHLAEAYLELGTLQAERGDLKQAIANYEQAIQTKPALTEAHYRLARAYKQSGQMEKARQEFDSYRRIEKQQAAERERERRELGEFVVVLKKPASEPAATEEHH